MTRDLARTAASFLLFARQDDPRLLLVLAIKHPHVADALDQRTAALLGEAGQNGVTLLAVADTRSHFHQFVRAEGGLEFFGDRRRQPGGTNENNRLTPMGEAAQILLLLFGKLLSHV